MTGDCCVFKFLRRSVDGKHLMRFQSETSVFKFVRRSSRTGPRIGVKMGKTDTLGLRENVE